MTYEEILIEAAAVSKACKLKDYDGIVRRFGLTQIINALPEEQRIEAHKVLNPPRRMTYGAPAPRRTDYSRPASA